MPKMKTHSGAKKRFKVTGSGKVRARHAFTSHILEKKSAKRKRALGAPTLVSEHDTRRVRRMLGQGAAGKVASAKTGRRGGVPGRTAKGAGS